MSLPRKPDSTPSSRRPESRSSGPRDSSRRRRRDLESGSYPDVAPSPYTPTSPRRHGHGRHVSHSSSRGRGASISQDSPTDLSRKRTLVRPERNQIGPDHPNYHYQQHAQNPNMATYPSTTGHDPVLDGPAETETGSTDSSVKTRTKTYAYPLDGNLNEPMERIERAPSSRHKRRRLYRRSSRKDIETEEKRQQKARQQITPPSPWYAYCVLITFWAPDLVLMCLGMRKPDQRRAWREKMGLIGVIALCCAFVGFITLGFTAAVCGTQAVRLKANSVDNGYMIFHGEAYDLSRSEHPAAYGIPAGSNVLYDLPHKYGGQDGSFMFQNVNGACKDVITLAEGSDIPTNDNGDLAWYFPCQAYNQDGSSTVNTTTPPYLGYMCHLSSDARNSFYGLKSSGDVYYTWDGIKNKSRNLVVYSGNVLDLDLLTWLNDSQVSYPDVFTEMRTNPDVRGVDLTYVFQSSEDRRIAKCLSQVIKVGTIDTMTVGCIASQVVLYVALIFILSVVFARFFMACLFHWFISKKYDIAKSTMPTDRRARAQQIEDWSDDIYRPAPRLADPPVPEKTTRKRATFLPTTSRFSSPYAVGGDSAKMRTQPLTMASQNSTSRLVPTATTASSMYKLSGNSSNGSLSMDAISRHNAAAGDSRTSLMISQYDQRHSTVVGSSEGPAGFIHENVVPQPPPEWQPFGFPLAHCLCLVTCYSEGEEGIRSTLDSVALTDYPNSHKTIIVICDGIIKGKGEEKSTPDYVLGMMCDFAVPPEEVKPHSYVAVASGSKRHNMAKIYAGFYDYGETSIVPPEKQQRVPMLVVVKCGTPAEASQSKPGNRGKRDSQIVLMSFLQKVMFDERMTELEFEMFNGFWNITGISPDYYEIILMVDADTKVFPDSLSHMVSAMVKDPEIMGLCGETKIANKTDSWVTMIQVFEYYISHHQLKAFESIFGGVTCLPGCFSMYRIKAPKGGQNYWVPILANPDVVEHYSENVVDTLHQKNLLLLGEDRYLSTLMLKTFPKRKQVFVPQAVCKTTVPDQFMVLLSQRRRWINSTVHNYFELLFVRDLCGTFCFSMQFVVSIDLMGSLVLPVAISLTFYVVIKSIVSKPVQIIPLVLLALIWGLPGVLIIVTANRLVYVLWMAIYLASIPIWNFVLPVYSFWKFDDFSWGDTRKTAGDTGKGGHGDVEGEFDSSKITMKRWREFEKERRLNISNAQGLPPGGLPAAAYTYPGGYDTYSDY
ncbi:Chitin synthase D [Talaromyces atroroseus]|uniref:chitin synthase n=1 Tax=Talaromyces atroroseus TaxID=1441469 RepID=A0A225AC15_TALAT|nr:Chitin synthase D [Talaromyces atroroseus]OKL58592.1 Chitin synthase D [Talaromyces atroroseus]